MLTEEQIQNMKKRQDMINALAKLVYSKGHTCGYELQSYPSQFCWCEKHDVCSQSKYGIPFTKTSFCDFCNKVPCVQVELLDIKIEHPCATICGTNIMTCGKNPCITEEIKTIQSHKECAKIFPDYDKLIMVIQTCEQEPCLGNVILRMKKDGHECGFIDYNNGYINWCESKNKCTHGVRYHMNNVKPKLYD
jgi:hypothetical protein